MANRSRDPRSLQVSFSHMDSGAWQHDEETGGEVLMLRSGEGFQAGLWRPGGTENTTIEVELEWDETVLVLAGSGSLEVDGGQATKLRAGLIVRLPKGARTRWVVDDVFRELWIYS